MNKNIVKWNDVLMTQQLAEILECDYVKANKEEINHYNEQINN